MLILQGVAFACLFMPLTTVALTTIPRHKLADATGLNSLLRQIGGSLGLAHLRDAHPALHEPRPCRRLARTSRSTRPEVAARLGAMTQAFMARGYDYDDGDASRGASCSAGWSRGRRSVLMFEKLFLFAGGLFLFVLPLLIFLKSPEHGEGVPKVEVHVEA